MFTFVHFLSITKMYFSNDCFSLLIKTILEANFLPHALYFPCKGLGDELAITTHFPQTHGS